MKGWGRKDSCSMMDGFFVNLTAASTLRMRTNTPLSYSMIQMAACCSPIAQETTAALNWRRRKLADYSPHQQIVSRRVFFIRGWLQAPMETGSSAQDGCGIRK